MEPVVQLQMPLPMDAIRIYCKKWRIREFAVFGSILREDFTDKSDIDVLVTFAEDVRYSLFDLVRMNNELESILGREVDLMTRRSVEQSTNPIRRHEILASSKVIYGA
jgi:predicted nucleotidyltransferase